MTSHNVCRFCNEYMQWGKTKKYKCGHMYHLECSKSANQQNCPKCTKKFVLEKPRCLSDRKQTYQGKRTILNFLRTNKNENNN